MNMHVTYDRKAGAAYIYLDKGLKLPVKTHDCNYPAGTVNIDHSSGKIFGIEVIPASLLSDEVLKNAEIIG